MGIKGLFKFISEAAPASIKCVEMQSFTSRILAVDASTCLYQFVIAVRLGADSGFQSLTNDAGEVTSHLSGFLNRTIKMMDAGIRPVYVFDGKPPEIKSGELQERKEKREKAEEALEEAKEAGDEEAILKHSKRTVHVTREMTETVKRLLRLLGCPVVDAPCEAEASCAALVKAGKAYAAVTEDMDVLTFGTPRMIKNLFNTMPGSGASGSAGGSGSGSAPGSAGGNKGRPIYEIHLQNMLTQLDYDMKQFVDFCILCGCDYCTSIRGVGPQTAYKLIRDHGSIEGCLPHVDSSKVPHNWMYKEARAMFDAPEVVDTASLQLDWTEPDYDGLRKLLIDENQFGQDRVERSIEKLIAIRRKKTQMRLENFFTANTAPVKTLPKFELQKKRPGTAGPTTKGKMIRK